MVFGVVQSKVQRKKGGKVWGMEKKKRGSRKWKKMKGFEMFLVLEADL